MDFHRSGGALLHWRKESIKALLESDRGELLILDLTNVRDLSTQALATLIRFQNAVACLNQRLILVAGDDLRKLLKKSRWPVSSSSARRSIH